jgi:hypothetical protein
MDQSGSGQGAVLIAANGNLAAASGSVVGRLSRPVLPGEYVSIYCTGLGAVSNQPASGGAAPGDQLALTNATPSVTIGGIPATVVFSGLAPGFVGLYQVNVQVPPNVPAGDALPAVVSIGSASSKTVTLASLGNTASSSVSSTDATGLATVSSGTVSIPVLLNDPLTGSPIQGVNVALGMPASQKGLAMLFVTDPQGRYPHQFLTLAAPRTAASATAGGAVTRVALAGNDAESPTAAPVQSGCPSGLPGNITVQPSIDSVNVPGPPPLSLLDAMRDAELAALNNYAAKAGLKLTFDDRQLGFASGSDCAQQFWDWIKPQATEAGKLYIALKVLQYGSGTELAVKPFEIFHALANLDVPAASAALKVCQSWVKGATLRTINMGNQRLLSAVLSGQPAPSNVVSQTVNTQNAQGQPVPSSICYVSAGTLAGDFAANTDASGRTVMNVPPDNYTVGITAPGYKPATQSVTLAGQVQPPPLNANLGPVSPQGPFTLTVVKSGDGSVTGSGIVCGSTCSATYTAGTVVTLTATPLTGSTFTGWSGACSGTGPCSVTMDANKAVTATFGTAPPPGGPLVFTAPATLPPATVGVPYTYNFCTPAPATPTSACGPMPPTTNPTGGNPPYHFQLGSGVGFPPMHLSLGKDGQLTGTPTAPGTSTFQVCAIDLSANSVCQTVMLTVTAPARLQASPSTVSLSWYSGIPGSGDPGTGKLTQVVTVTNSGGGTLSGTATVSASVDWLKVSPASFPLEALAAGNSVSVTVWAASGFVTGTNTGTVTIAAPGISPLTIPVTLVINVRTASKQMPGVRLRTVVEHRRATLWMPLCKATPVFRLPIHAQECRLRRS